MFKTIHQAVEVKSDNYWNQLRRKNYVTPTSYLELLECFKSLLEAQRKKV
jgi:dynein heavy chain